MTTIEEIIKSIHDRVDYDYNLGFEIRPSINKATICLDKGTSLDQVTTTKEQIENWKKPNITLEQWEIDFFKSRCEATDQQIDNIRKYGYFANGFNILMGFINRGQFADSFTQCFDFDNDNDITLNDFRNTNTLEDLAKSHYIEHHTHPSCRIHLIVRVDKNKLFRPINESSKDFAGLAVHANHWITTAPSPYNTQYNYTKLEGGIDLGQSKIIRKDSKEFNDLSDRILSVESEDKRRKQEEEIIQLLNPYLENEGKRHDTWLHFVGMLVKDTEKEEEEIRELVTKVCEHFNDDQVNDRLKCIDTTKERIAKDLEVSGYKGLESIMEKQDLDNLKKLVGVANKASRRKVETDDDDEKKKKKSQLQIIDEILESSGEEFIFFKDQFSRYYIRVNNKEIIELDTKDPDGRIYEYLRSVCRNSEDYPNFRPNVEPLNTIIKDFRVSCTESKLVYNLDVRCAKDPDNDYVLYYDLVDEDHRVVKITPNDWSIDDNSPPLFRRYIGLNSKQVEPLHDNKNNSSIFHSFLDKLIHSNNPDIKLVIKVYLVGVFIPHIIRPMLTLCSPQDSGKTGVLEKIKSLIDPSTAYNSKLPNSQELSQMMDQNYYIALDNIKKIIDTSADDICRGITGGSDRKRAHYTNAGNIVFNFKRAFAYTSRYIASKQSDLLDRSLLINDELRPVTADTRRKETDISKEFEKYKPNLLGYIFDILSQVLKMKEQIDIQNKTLNCVNKNNRLLDFAEYCELISIAMGNEEGEFSKIYEKVQSKRTIEVLNNSTIGRAMMELMDDLPLWSGDPTTLHLELKNTIMALKVKEEKRQLDEDEYISQEFYFPSDIRAFMKEVYKLSPLLKMQGIIITALPARNSQRKIEIRNLKVEKEKRKVEDEKTEQAVKEFFENHKTEQSVHEST